MTDEELEAWAETRPESIRIAVKKRDPRKLYRMGTGHIVTIFSIDEHDNDKCQAPECEHRAQDGITFTVLILNKHNSNLLFERRVFGVPLDELHEVPPGTNQSICI